MSTTSGRQPLTAQPMSWHAGWPGLPIPGYRPERLPCPAYAVAHLVTPGRLGPVRTEQRPVGGRRRLVCPRARARHLLRPRESLPFSRVSPQRVSWASALGLFSPFIAGWVVESPAIFPSPTRPTPAVLFLRGRRSKTHLSLSQSYPHEKNAIRSFCLVGCHRRFASVGLL